MPPGKLASQAGHGFTDAFADCLDRFPDRFRAYRTDDRIGGTKVVIKARNLARIERARRECVEAGIPHALVVDRDHVLLPYFTGAPIVTALGIGPVTKAESRHILKRFSAVA